MDWLRAPSSEKERERDVYVQQLLLFIMTATIYNSIYHTYVLSSYAILVGSP